jgi:hypothetical protein
VRGEQDAHAQGLADLGDALAERAFAENAERRAGQIVDRVGEEAELRGLLPAAVDDVLPVTDNAAAKISAKACSGTVLTA